MPLSQEAIQGLISNAAGDPLPSSSTLPASGSNPLEGGPDGSAAEAAAAAAAMAAGVHRVSTGSTLTESSHTSMGDNNLFD